MHLPLAVNCRKCAGSVPGRERAPPAARARGEASAHGGVDEHLRADGLKAVARRDHHAREVPLRVAQDVRRGEARPERHARRKHGLVKSALDQERRHRVAQCLGDRRKDAQDTGFLARIVRFLMLDRAHVAARRRRATLERRQAHTLPVGVVGARQIGERLPGRAVIRNLDHDARRRVKVGGVLPERGILAHVHGNHRGDARDRLHGAEVGRQHDPGRIGGVRGKRRRKRDRLRIERIEYLADDGIGWVVGRQTVQLERGGAVLAQVRARRDEENGRPGGLRRDGGAYAVHRAAHHHHVRLVQRRRHGGGSGTRHRQHHTTHSAFHLHHLTTCM